MTFSNFFSVHPCDRTDNGECQQNCTKKGEIGVCSCDDGFKLNEDKKTCQKGMNFLRLSFYTKKRPASCNIQLLRLI